MSIMLLQKILGCVWILFLLSLEIHGQCSKPVLSDNVVLVGTTFEEGSSEKLSCDPGYAPEKGKAMVLCLDGKWNPNPQDFTCKKKSCGNPGDVPNGRYDMAGGIDFGSTITAICNEGYQLFGNAKRSCTVNGTWDGQKPVCEAVKCGRPPSIENGRFESAPEEPYDNGNAVRYVCNDDYTLFGKSETICKNGDWTEAPRCKKVECPRPNIANAVRVQGGSGPYGYKSTLTYACNEGFKMVSGEARIVCMENGWSSMPKCEVVAIECPNPGSTNATITDGSGGPYKYGAILTYKCQAGHRLVGSTHLKCGSDGQWSYKPPTCQVDDNNLLKILLGIAGAGAGGALLFGVWYFWGKKRGKTDPHGTTTEAEEGVELKSADSSKQAEVVAPEPASGP